MDGHLVEGVARVVATDGDTVWLEPEQGEACEGCLSAAGCGVKSGGSNRRLLARRFSMVNSFDGQVGDRVVFGISERTLLRASALAYSLPLILMVGGAMAGKLMTGSDGGSALASVLGLAAGLLFARFRAGRLDAKGELSPHFLRYAYGPGPSEHCDQD